MNTAVNKAVEEGWQQDVKSKSSLKYVNVDSLKAAGLIIYGQQSKIVYMTAEGPN